MSKVQNQPLVQEEEDLEDIESEIFGNIIEYTIGSIVDLCVSEVCPENKKPSVFFRQLQKLHPEIQGKIEESLSGVAKFFEENGEKFKDEIKKACDTLIEHLEKY